MVKAIAQTPMITIPKPTPDFRSSETTSNIRREKPYAFDHE